MDAIAIIPLTTGHVRIHDDMHRGRGTGLRRRARILRKGPMGEALPIHAWLIDHPEGRILVDSGETHVVHDGTFAQFQVGRGDELDRQLATAGVGPDEIPTVVLTHIHGDHVNGLVHVPGARVLAGTEEIEIAGSVAARMTRRFTKQPLPTGFAPQPITLDGPPVGAFPSSAALTADGRVLAVPTPGHTLGHLAILVVQPDHHVLIGGDTAYDLQQLLDGVVDGVSPKDDVSKATMNRIREHGRRHPTVYLPSHDPDAVARLRDTTTLP
jgi:glyoxylase-like metal-dependent hydrolase (beta-lactamase superfamily II)